MEFLFGVVNTIATAVIVLLTLLNIIAYKLRQIQEANLRDVLLSSSSQPSQFQEAKAASNQVEDTNLVENSSFPLRSGQLCRHFTLGEILLATNNFDDTLVIGRGGFGKVYKGVIDDGTVTVAIKRSNPVSMQGAPQFWTEVELLSRFRHSHLVSLIGYCYNPTEMILVYEYMPHGSLADHLYKTQSNLSWISRLKICIGAGQGLEYLHTGTGINNRVIHRDMKSSNILLDGSWAAKVSDFGLSKIGPANQDLTHVSTNVKGTYGYFDPEYMATHRLTRKSDVYSFGVVLLEVLSGKRAMDPKVCEEYWDLTVWAKECMRKKEVDKFIDPYLKHEILPNSLKEYVQIAEKCLQNRSRKRPTMAEVVASLEHVLALQERIDSSMFEMDFMNLGWNQADNQEDNQESPDDSTEVNAEVIDDVVLSGNSLSHVLPSRTTPFKRFARFFRGKSRVNSVNETSNSLSSLEYDFDTLKVATNNFSDRNKIEEGGLGAVFKGKFQDGTLIAVKKISDYVQQTESEFRKRMALIAKLQHSNLVNLLGFCLKGTDRFLVYPLFTNSSLKHFIDDPARFTYTDTAYLGWEQCTKIIKGILRGIVYLHEHSPVRIIHRDIKPSHILFDEEMTPKVSGFRVARPLEDGEIEVTTTVCGTLGYVAPEYFESSRVSLKADVYSFGMLVLSIISGLRPVFDYSNGTQESLENCAMRNWREGAYWDILICPNLSMSNSEDVPEIKRYIHIASLCIQLNQLLRPTMSEVLLMLDNRSMSLPEPSFHSSSSRPTSFVDNIPDSFNEDSFNEDSSSELSPR